MSAIRKLPRLRQRPLGRLDPRHPGRGKHGLSRAAIDGLVAAQDYRCAICGADITPVGAAAIDHDHRRAEDHPHPRNRACDHCRRSALCMRCNDLLGRAGPGGDSVAVLERAVAYLRAWDARLGGRRA
jgi:DNA-directed RNA polymerase subunit RPC12/RpoP